MSEAVDRQVQMLAGFVNINFLCYGGYRICSEGLNRLKNSGLAVKKNHSSLQQNVSSSFRNTKGAD